MEPADASSALSVRTRPIAALQANTIGATALALSLATLAACSRGGAREAGARVDELAGPRAASLRLLLVTDLEGVLEACGCTSRPAGGVDRLRAEIEAARHEGVPTFALAAGQLFATAHEGVERQQEIWQADTLALALAQMRFDLIAPAASDFTGQRARLAQLARTSGAVVLGAQASSDETGVVTRTRSSLQRVGGLQIGVAIAPAELEHSALASADMQREVASLRRRGARIVVLLASSNAVGTTSTAQASGADLVLRVGPGELSSHAAVTANGTLQLDAGRRGEGLLSVDLWLASAHSQPLRLVSAAATPADPIDRDEALVRYRELVASVVGDRELRALLDQTFARVNAYNREHGDAPRQAPPGTASYAGSDTCAACHTQAYLGWQLTPHGRAFETLVARGRQLDLDCIGCHTTGFEQPGGSSLAKLEHLRGVGCESCHGPGSKHADNPGAGQKSIARSVPERLCLSCHDVEHSDGFSYASALERLRSPSHAHAAKPSH